MLYQIVTTLIWNKKKVFSNRSTFGGKYLRHHPKHTFSLAYYEIKASNVFPSFIIHYNSDYTGKRRDPEDEAFTFDLLSCPGLRLCLCETESTTPLTVLRDAHSLAIPTAQEQPFQNGFELIYIYIYIYFFFFCVLYAGRTETWQVMQFL